MYLGERSPKNRIGSLVSPKTMKIGCECSSILGLL